MFPPVENLLPVVAHSFLATIRHTLSSNGNYFHPFYRFEVKNMIIDSCII